MRRAIALVCFLAASPPAWAASPAECEWIKGLLTTQEDRAQKYAMEIFSFATDMRSPKMRFKTYDQLKPSLDMNDMIYRKLAETVTEHLRTIERGQKERCLSKAEARTHTETGEHFWQIGREAYRNTIPGAQ